MQHLLPLGGSVGVLIPKLFYICCEKHSFSFLSYLSYLS